MLKKAYFIPSKVCLYARENVFVGGSLKVVCVYKVAYLIVKYL